jgi:cobalamin biosynthesis protein CobC
MEAAKNRVRHGGDPAAMARAFPDAPRPWLDLSTGINPLPYALPTIPHAAWSRLPLLDEVETLRFAAARAYGAPGPDHVAAAPGTQVLIGLLPRLRASGRTAILGPTYGEHAPAWVAGGHDTITVTNAADLAAADVAVVVNPNNPDGRRLAPSDLLALADHLAARGGWLVVDEAFADVVPEVSVAAAVGRKGLVVLRSFGKFHGLAGLRLGFALADPPTIAAIAAALGPWAISGPAIVIGTQALGDEDWAVATRARLRSDAGRLDRLLHRAGGEILGGTDLFRLVRTAVGVDWTGRLGIMGIHVRGFDGTLDTLRFGLPGTEACWQRLAAALGTTTD